MDTNIEKFLSVAERNPYRDEAFIQIYLEPHQQENILRDAWRLRTAESLKWAADISTTPGGEPHKNHQTNLALISAKTHQLQFQMHSSSQNACSHWELHLWTTSRKATQDIWPAGCVIILWIKAGGRLQLAAHEGRAAVVLGAPTSHCPRWVAVLPCTCSGTALQSGWHMYTQSTWKYRCYIKKGKSTENQKKKQLKIPSTN